MDRPHPGIRIDQIQVEGIGGLIFAIGFAVLFLFAVPSFAPIVAGCVAAGVLLAPILYLTQH